MTRIGWQCWLGKFWHITKYKCPFQQLGSRYHVFIIDFAAYKEKIPFVKPAPIEEQETKKQKKHRDAQKKTQEPNIEAGLKDMNLKKWSY